ncbi:MAG: hypothetical protein ACLPY1_06955, partial [Terracidiphilus sp.]
MALIVDLPLAVYTKVYTNLCLLATRSSVVSPKFLAFVLHYLVCRELPEKQVPFDYAQGRLSAPLKNA